jgi:hypothetical protein
MSGQVDRDDLVHALHDLAVAARVYLTRGRVAVGDIVHMISAYQQARVLLEREGWPDPKDGHCEKSVDGSEPYGT